MPTICRVAEIQIHDVCALRMNARGALLDAADLHSVDAMRHKPPESVLYTRTEAPITMPAQRKKHAEAAIDFYAKRYLYVRDPHR